MKMSFVGVLLLMLITSSCGGGSSSSSTQTTPAPPAGPYLPLAVGNTWSYTCNNSGGNITDTVTQTVTVGSQQVFAVDMQFPNAPDQTFLLANDTSGNTTFYGYLINGAVMAEPPTPYVSASPTTSQVFDYPAPDGTIIKRRFTSVTSTNPTALGLFQVAVYDENDKPAYGYFRGKGVLEQDHNYPQFDCTITSLQVHSQGGNVRVRGETSAAEAKF